jgi:hypothetical protein
MARRYHIFNPVVVPTKKTFRRKQMADSRRIWRNVTGGAFRAAILSTVSFVALTFSDVQPARADACANLAALSLPNVTLTSETVPAGTYTTQYGLNLSTPTQLPAFCRVAGAAHPTSDSNILFEVWLPLSQWNGRYRAYGEGGYSGTIQDIGLADGLQRGFASSNTDRGHESPTILDGSWALGHPEKIIDVAYRGDHVTAVAAKQIIKAFYGKGPQYSYYEGCSGGGYEGVQAATRFPDDYDGVLYGAPGINWVGVSASFIWEAQATLNPAGAASPSFIPSTKLPMITAAVLAACDHLDGVVDGLLEDPRRCHFDPAVLQCKSGDAPTCLTTPQVEAVRKMYYGAHNPRTGELIYPGLEPSSEAPAGAPLNWSFVDGSSASGPSPFFGDQFFKYFVFNDPNWNFHTMNFDNDIALANQKWGAAMNAPPDLREFAARGNKIISYNGWVDPVVNPQEIIRFTEEVLRTNGDERGKDSDERGKDSDFLRLYMVPGMSHCGSGPGPNCFGQPPGTAAGCVPSNDPKSDVMAALIQWVEKGIAPHQIIATKHVNDDPTQGVSSTRPLCPYPQVARWKGTGLTNVAANFVCVAESHKESRN